MVNLLDIFLMKEKFARADAESDGKMIYWMVLEKLSIVLSLVLVFAGALALNLPWWAIGAIIGFSLGPIVYGHYYFIYIRPMMKQREG